MFSSPVKSGLNPAPSSSSAATRPLTFRSPVVGASVPHTICKSVDFPAPLRPTMPTTSPGLMAKFTPLSAQKSRK